MVASNDMHCHLRSEEIFINEEKTLHKSGGILLSEYIDIVRSEFPNNSLYFDDGDFCINFFNFIIIFYFFLILFEIN